MGFFRLCPPFPVGMAVDGLGYQAADCPVVMDFGVAPAVPAWGGRTGKEPGCVGHHRTASSIALAGTRAASPWRPHPLARNDRAHSLVHYLRLLTLPLTPIRAHSAPARAAHLYTEVGKCLRCAFPYTRPAMVMIRNLKVWHRSMVLVACCLTHHMTRPACSCRLPVR